MSLRVELLGSPRITADGELLHIPNGKPMALLAYLASPADHPHTREHLASLLWGDRPDKYARRSLRQCLMTLRKALGAYSDVIAADRNEVRANGEQLSVDAAELEARAEEPSRDDLEQAVKLYKGEFLEGVVAKVDEFDTWRAAERLRLRELCCLALEKLSRREDRPTATTHSIAIPAARKWIELEPLAEPAHLRLIDLLTATGNKLAAVRHARRCQKLFRDELGVHFSIPKHLNDQSGMLSEQAITLETIPLSSTFTRGSSSDYPSVAVMPIVNLTGNDEDEVFVDAFTDDLTTALSRVPRLFVIASPSAFTYKDVTSDRQNVFRELGVRYVVEGSFLRIRGKVHVNAKLVEHNTKRHLSVETLEAISNDPFEHYDEWVRRVAASTQTQITLHEGENNVQSGDTRGARSQALARAWSEIYKLSQSSLEEALRLAKEVKAHNAEDALAHQVEAVARHHLVYLGCSVESWQAELGKAHSAAQRAVDLYENDEYSHWILGSTYVLLRDTGRAVAELERALEINPNCSMAYGSLGTALAWAGDTERALLNNEIAIRSNPRDPSIFLRFFVHALAHFVSGRYEDASYWSELATQRKRDFPNAQWLKAAALILEGNRAKAMSVLDEYPWDRSALTRMWFTRSGDQARLRDALELPPGY